MLIVGKYYPLFRKTRLSSQTLPMESISRRMMLRGNAASWLRPKTICQFMATQLLSILGLGCLTLSASCSALTITRPNCPRVLHGSYGISDADWERTTTQIASSHGLRMILQLAFADTTGTECCETVREMWSVSILHRNP